MTAAGRTTTARLQVGDKILVEPARIPNTWVSTTRKLTGKNGVIAATIVGREQRVVSNGRRSTTMTTLALVDQGGSSIGQTLPAPPSQTFALA